MNNSILISKKRTVDYTENLFKQNTPDLPSDIISQIFLLIFSLTEFKQLATLSRSWREFSRDVFIEKIDSFKINSEFFIRQFKVETKEFLSGKMPFSRPLGLAEAHEKYEQSRNPGIPLLSKVYLKVISKTYDKLGHQKSLELFTTCKVSQKVKVLYCVLRHSRLKTEISFSNVVRWVDSMKVTILTFQKNCALKFALDFFLQEAFLFSIDSYFQDKDESSAISWLRLFSDITEFNFMNKNQPIEIQNNKSEKFSDPCIHRLSFSLYQKLENADPTVGALKVLSFLHLIPNQILKKQIGKSLCFRFYYKKFSSENIPNQWELAMEISRTCGFSKKYTKIIFTHWLEKDQKMLLKVLKTNDYASINFQINLIKTIEKCPEFLVWPKAPLVQLPNDAKLPIYQTVLDLFLHRGMQGTVVKVLNHIPLSPLRTNLQMYIDNFLVPEVELIEIDTSVGDNSIHSIEVVEEIKIDSDDTFSYYHDLDLSA